MILLSAMNIEKQFGERTILDFKELKIYRGDKIGIVGANGAGKTTLVNILAGKTKPDNGVVTTKGAVEVLEQFPEEGGTLSGGEKQKKNILKIIGRKNLLLFADEPTANLDTDGRKWLADHLKKLESLVIISHDRDLLDMVCNRIAEVEAGRLKFYTGNYSSYLGEKAQKEEQILESRRVYKNKKKQLENAIVKKERTLSKMKQQYKRDKLKNNSEARLGIHRRKAVYKQIEKENKIIGTRIDKLETPDHILKRPVMKIDFGLTNPPMNKILISSENVTFGYGNGFVLDNASFEIRLNEKLAICGSNGSGKTTFFRQIIGNNSAIIKAPKLKIGYLSQDFSHVAMEKTVLENVLLSNIQTMDTVYQVLAGLLFRGTDTEKKASALSGGERLRLSLAMLVLSDVNALFLDEPTNFLDIPSMEVLEETLIEYPGLVVFISHDKKIVDKVATRKLFLENGKVLDKSKTENKSSEPVKVNRLTLDLERSRLVEELAVASDKKKEVLEKRYAEVLKLLALKL